MRAPQDALSGSWAWAFAIAGLASIAANLQPFVVCHGNSKLSHDANAGRLNLD